MRRLTAEGLGNGGDFCDLYFENTSYRDLLLRDGEVTSGGFHVDYGVGIRVLSGEKTGYAYSESTDMPSMLSAAKAAAQMTCMERIHHLLVLMISTKGLQRGFMTHGR